MSIQATLDKINAEIIKKDLPRFDVGDSINVHFRIVEGAKERVQVFSGVVISRHGGGINEMVVVRRVVDDYGVERIFPINSPKIAMYEVTRRGQATRAKLYFLRDRSGKSQRIIDRRRKLKHVAGLTTVQGG